MAVIDGSMALELALLFGVLHAFEPGHGKTAMFTYMLNARRTCWHAAWLGLTTGLAHSAVVIIIAISAHLVGHWLIDGGINHDHIAIPLRWLSGCVLLGIGAFMLYRALQSKTQGACCRQHDHRREGDSRHLVHDFRLTTAVGVTVGMMPCPTLIAAFMAALGTGRTELGVQAVGLFAIGLVICVTCLGIAFRYVSHQLGHLSRYWQLLQAVIIATMGAAYLAGAMATDYQTY